MEIIFGLIVLVCLVLVIKKNIKPSEEKLQAQQEKYEALLKQFGVPENHIKIVISTSKVYQLHNCPAVVWIEGDMVKSLLFRLNPIVAESELEDFMYIASQPLVDFKRFDGTDYPDWAVQTDYVKKLFLPYAELTESKGGIDYKRQMYWIGTMCVYAPSLAEFFKLIGRPLSAYDIRVDDVARMKADGSIPAEMLEAHEKAKAEAKEETAQKAKTMEMDAALANLKEAIEIVHAAQKQTDGEEYAERVNQLVKKLLEEGKTDELLRSTTDKEYQQELLEKYGL